MTKGIRDTEEALELPDYESQTAPLLDSLPNTSSSHASDAILAGSGMVRVDVIDYPNKFKPISDNQLQDKNTRLTSCLVEHSADYHDFIAAIQEQLADLEAVDDSKRELACIRFVDAGPKIHATLWQKLHSKIQHVEAVLEPNVELKRSLRRQKHCEHVCLVAYGVVVVTYIAATLIWIVVMSIRHQ